MARMRRRDRINDDPVGKYNETKSALDEAITSYESGETVTPGQITGSAFPMAPASGGTPSVDVRKTDAESFTSVVEEVPGASPRNLMPENVDAIGGKPKPGRPMKRPSTVQFAVGARGEGVGELQQFLKEQGYYAGEIDNAFGGQTEDAVKAYQRAKGLKDDGMVGTNRLAALKADMTSPPAVDAAVSDADIVAMDMPTRSLMEDRLGETDLFPAPSDDRLKTSDTGLRGMSMADMRKMPLIEQLLSMSKNDRAVVADLLKSDTGQ